MLEESKKTGKPKATMLEKMTAVKHEILSALGIENEQNERLKIKYVGVYN